MPVDADTPRRVITRRSFLRLSGGAAVAAAVYAELGLTFLRA